MLYQENYFAVSAKVKVQSVTDTDNEFSEC